MVKEEVKSMDESEAISIMGTKSFAQKFAGIVKTKPVPNSIKKKRTNFRLRKVLAPKAPLMVLNEIVGTVNYTFPKNPVASPINTATNTPTSLDPGYIKMLFPNLNLFSAQCVVDGEIFSGTGISKQIAKNVCAENAIAHLVVKKSEEAKSKEQTDAEGNPLMPNQMEDETPWMQLASLALFKLFSDWQSQGKTVPNVLWRVPDGKDTAEATNTSGGAIGMFGPQKPAKKLLENPNDMHLVQLLNGLHSGVIFNPGDLSYIQPNDGLLFNHTQNLLQARNHQWLIPRPQKPAKKLPENPTDKHPVQLLNELHGGVIFNPGEVGTSPNIKFTIGVDIDGKMYNGEGKTKKEAKKNCAIEVLKQVHNIVFNNTGT